MIKSSHLEKLKPKLSVPVVIITRHLVKYESEECIIWTISFLLGDESRLSVFCGHRLWPPGLLIHSAALIFPPSIVTSILPFYCLWVTTVGRGKKCINNVFLRSIRPQINGDTKTIYKDGWLKAIFDHFHCAQSRFPFLQARWDSIISKCL